MKNENDWNNKVKIIMIEIKNENENDENWKNNEMKNDRKLKKWLK